MDPADLPLLLSAIAALAALARVRPIAPAVAWLLFTLVRALDLHQWLAALFAGLPVTAFTPVAPVPRMALFEASLVAGLLPLAVAFGAAVSAHPPEGLRFARRLAGILALSLALGGSLDVAGKLLPARRALLVQAEAIVEAGFDLVAALVFLKVAASLRGGTALAAAAQPVHFATHATEFRLWRCDGGRARARPHPTRPADTASSKPGTGPP